MTGRMEAATARLYRRALGAPGLTERYVVGACGQTVGYAALKLAVAWGVLWRPVGRPLRRALRRLCR